MEGHLFIWHYALTESPHSNENKHRITRYMTAKKKTKRKNIFLQILCRILGTLLIITVFAVLIPISVPRIMGGAVYNVVSPSMAPEIPVNSLIAVQPVDPVELKEEDIIAYYRDDVIITHRVTNNNTLEGKITTKGDANEEEDLFLVTYNQVIGKVTWHVPFLGGLAQVLTSTAGKIYLLAVLACGIMFHMIAGQLKTLAE